MVNGGSSGGSGRLWARAAVAALLLILLGVIAFLSGEVTRLEGELDRAAEREEAGAATARVPEEPPVVAREDAWAAEEIAALRGEIDRLRGELATGTSAGAGNGPADAPRSGNLDAIEVSLPILETGGYSFRPVEIRDGAFMIANSSTSNPSAPAWSEIQALGAPDTPEQGDHPSAWAPLRADDGLEWLEIDFPEEVVPHAIVIIESFNPGAVIRVEVARRGGAYRTLWSGRDPATEERNEFAIPYAGNIPVASVRITLDTTLVSGWNEIDAVGLEVGDETVWGSAARASSSFARQE